ncbi:SSU ribosomal protein S1p [Pediococcus damnosus]|uniref:30S ribosomal protein S1 n=1 Tax=Pediococcus damnosus TaxID=51663 RepID=UPI00078C6A86|nr:30S ribosomal protein S1 [Pediococcus damnosus]AMV65919.1 SSU ribosomal protein S1p [Pediococcus damnosus]
MSENESGQNNDLLNALNSVEDVKVGDVVTGEVLDIDDDKQAIVGIEGTGVEGAVPLRELSTAHIDDINDAVKVGDKLDLVVISKIGNDKEGGSYLLSHKRIEARKVWDDIQKKADAGEEIEAPVTQVVKGGLVVDAGVRGFIPASMIEDRYVEDLSVYKGQTLKLKIVEVDPAENRLILSHKAIVQAENAAKRKELMEHLKAGDIVEGTVARLTNFGAFVDLGGVDGLVHVSEIAYEHVNKPSDKLKVGQKINVKVLSIDEERGHISLSLKQTLPGPWDDIEEKAPAGSVIEGTVRRLTDFGAFVEVFPGVEGLVHISQISHEHIDDPSDVLKTGDKIKVKVLEVHPDAHRLALSIKALEEAPKSEPKHNSNNNNNNSRSKRPAANNYRNNAPEESTGFTLGDLVGKALKDSQADNDKK